MAGLVLDKPGHDGKGSTNEGKPVDQQITP